MGRAEVIVLDTHALIWWVSGDTSLSAPAHAVIEEAYRQGEILVSSITAWEIAMLVQRGRIGLATDLVSWLSAVEKIPGVKFVPVDNIIALDAVTLPSVFHKDPADRIITATARKFSVPILTADEKIAGYKHVKTVW